MSNNNNNNTFFCRDSFWDSSSNPNDPDFTECFQKSVLAWIPSIFLFIYAPFFMYGFIIRETEQSPKNRRFKFNYLIFSKLLILVGLLILEVITLILEIIEWKNVDQIVYSINVISPVVLIITYVMVGIIILINRKYGKKYNIILMLYWMINIFCSIIVLRSKAIHFGESSKSRQEISIYISSFVLKLIIFVTCFINDSTDEKFNPKVYPESNVSLIKWFTFTWITGLVYKGYKKDLDKDDVWDIDEENSCLKLSAEFEKCWNSLIHEYNKSKGLENVSVKYTNGQVSTSNGSKKENVQKRPSLKWFLIKYYAKDIIMSGFIRLVYVMFDIASPFLLSALIDFISEKSESKIVGFFLAILLYLKLNVQTLCLQHSFHRSFLLTVRTRNALMNIVYKKSLKLSNDARKTTTTGEILNLMQVNCQSFLNFCYFMNTVWVAPVQVVIAFILLWFYIGWAMFAGLGVLVVMIPIKLYLSSKYNQSETKNILIKDSRIKMMNEILNGIKVLKFYGWELSFKKLISSIREKELKMVKHCTIYSSLFNFNFTFLTGAITVVSLAVYVYSDSRNVLDPSTAYVCLLLFNSIKIPLYLFGVAVPFLINVKVSTERLENFLYLDEIDDTQISYNSDKNSKEAIIVKNSSLTWNNDNNHISLKNLTFDVPKGSLVAIVGKVGSGKSSILSALLGEMNKLAGEININGSISYVAQQAWIQNETLKNNILFGKPLDESFYARVVKSCALSNDLNILPAGDQTEIGEKGINLSGGQKQRISLARAVYNDSDIYFLDDSLSAVDAHVGKHIFENVIGPSGILNKKTRLFVTNSISFLPQVDRIMMLENGCIVEIGPYESLINANGSFVNFINKQKVESESEQDTDDLDPKKEADSKDDSSTIAAKKENVELENKSKKNDPNQTIAGEKIIEKEAIQKGNVKFSQLFEYLKESSFILVGIFFLFSILMNVSLAGSSFWLSDWTNTNIKPNVTNAISQDVRMGVYGALILISNVFSFILEIVTVYMVVNSARNFHNSMLNSIMQSTMQFFESTPVGRILNRFSKDLTSIEFTIPTSFKDFIYCIFDGVTNLIIICITTPLFMTVLAPITIFYVVFQRYYVASASKLKRLDGVSKSPIFAHFSESINGTSTIKAYKAEQRFIRLLETKIDDNNKFVYPSYVADRWLGVNLEMVGNLISLFAMIFAIIAKDSISPGLAALSITFSLTVSNVLRYGVKTTSELESNLTSVERVKEYSVTPSEADWIIKDKSPPSDWPSRGNIKFVNYSVKYREELDNVLKSINCEIKSNEKIGIVGRTGAGKSSLSLALFRILESNEGQIIIDDIDIKSIGLHDLRQRLTIIPQDPVIFSGSLRMNLDPFEMHSDEQLWNALDKVHLKDYVQSLDNKLLFECTEGGDNLSVGQKQLLCLARALVRNTKIIVLDEATAAIDHNTDELVQKTIRSEFKNCTILTIAHRLNTIIDSDRIMVLDKGQIVEFDTPANLLANEQSIFYSMAASAGGIVK